MKKFVLYTNKCKTEKGYTTAVWRHSFACTLSEAVKQWKCVIQILKFQRFYYSIYAVEHITAAGTKFNILLFPIVYLYALIDRKQFLQIKLV